MSWVIHIIEVYIVAILLIVHTSLLFCKLDHCAFDSSAVLTMVSPNITNFISKILSIVPISLEGLQLIAHFLLLGDVILIVWLFLKTVGSVFKYIIGTFLLALVLCFVIYMFVNGGIGISGV